MNYKIVKIELLLAVMVLADGASAERYTFVGNRASGMGGANAATVNDSSAQWHNPAAFGFFSRQPDPVQGPVTNAVTNVITTVTNGVVTNVVAVADTNAVADMETVDTNFVAQVDDADTNVVAESEAADIDAGAEMEDSDTNAVALADDAGTHAVADMETADTNFVALVDGADTDVVAESEAADSHAEAEVEDSNTNAVALADATGTNAVPEDTGMDTLLAVMEESEAPAAGLLTTNIIVETVPVTNETYDISYEVVMAETIPERARVDNGGLGDRGFGWNVFGIGAGYTMTDEIPEYITQLGQIDFDAFDGTGLDPTAAGVESMLLISSALFGLGSNPDNALYADATAGMNFRIGHVGFGIRTFGEVAGFVDYLDTANLGVEQTESDLITSIITAAAGDGFNPGTWTYQSINPGDLNISLSAGGSDAEAYIDYQLTQLKRDGVITDKNINDSVFMVNQVTYGQDPNDPGSSSIENNKSTVTARGFGLLEIPVSYGYAFNDNLSVGITAKGMYGTVTGTKVRFADGDSFDAAMDNLEENTEASFNFGLDLGVLYRMKKLQFGAVAHNINAPKFNGFNDVIEIENDAGVVVDTVPIHVPDYTIDPQITLGAALIPSKRFSAEMSYDLLKTGTLMENYDIQRIAFGTELDLWMLAFRLGMYNNLAADWQDWVATGGVGLNLYICRLDIGGAYSIGNTTEYEGTEIPEEARAYASLSFEF